MKHFLNDIEISPKNRTEIGIISTFTDEPDVLKLSTDTIVLPREGFDIVKNHIATIGVFEGIPYRVELSGGISIDYYVDLTENTVIKQHEIEVKIKRRKGQDSFIENANATSFDLLLSKGVSFDTFNVPYFVIKDDQLQTAITLAITTYVMVKETIQAAVELVNSISDIIEAATPVLGVSAAGPTVSYNTGAIITASLKATAKLIYFAALVVALLDMASKLFVLIFPPKYNLLGCKVKELISKGCGYLGYSFQSTLLDSIPQATILPVPLVRDRKSIFEFLPDEFNAPFNKGVPSASDTTPTVGSLIDAICTQFNARVKIYNGVVRIERWDWWQNQATNMLEPALSLQGERDDAYVLNTNDIWKRYYIRYQLDMSDLNTYDKLYDRHDAEYSTEPTTVVNSDLVSIKGLQQVDVPFALGRRKEKLNWLEKRAKDLFKLIDSVSSIFGSGTNYENVIGERKDCMQISQRFFSTTKFLYTVNGKQPENYMNFISAGSLWNQYHYINQIQLNSWKIKNQVRVRLKASEFVTLLDNNYIELNGEICEILSCEWIDEKSSCLITYREPSNYAAGKVQTITIND